MSLLFFRIFFPSKVGFSSVKLKQTKKTPKTQNNNKTTLHCHLETTGGGLTKTWPCVKGNGELL